MITALLLLLAVLATTGRAFLTIGLSIVTGWLLGYLAIKSRTFESAYLNLIGVFESVPVISFFPVVLVFFIRHIKGYAGVELAADFLVFTAVVWNIWVGIYQAFKTIPLPMLEVVENLRYGFLGKLRKLYIPYSVPRIAANLMPSFADAYFYIVVSEVVTIGTSEYEVFGIGSLLAKLVSEASTYPAYWQYVYMGLAELAAVVALVVVGLRRFANWSVAKYSLESAATLSRRRPVRWRTLSRYYGPVVRPVEAVVRRGGRAFTQVFTAVPLRRVEVAEEHDEINVDLIVKIVGLIVLALIAYGTAVTVISTSAATWAFLLRETPTILLDLAYDYVRVALIAVVSFVIAVFLGYWLAMHRRAEAVAVPIIQALSALPAPAYFPLLFAATYFVVSRFFGGLTDEFYAVLLGFVSTFYYIFYSYWLGIKAVPIEVLELMDNLGMGFFKRMRKVLIPGTMPYIVAGLASTINSAWGGLMVGEYWPNVYGGRSLVVHHGLMALLDVATLQGDIALASWASLIFGVFVVIFSTLFTRNLMDLARRKYVIEESVYAA